MIYPVNGYVYGQEVKKETGVVTETGISDTKQRYKVLAIAPNYLHDGEWIDLDQSLVGKTVIIEAHAAEGNTPKDVMDSGHAIFLYFRIIAVEEE